MLSVWRRKYRQDFTPRFHFLHLVWVYIFLKIGSGKAVTTHIILSGLRIWPVSVSWCEIAVFNPQAWDSRLRRESWRPVIEYSPWGFHSRSVSWFLFIINGFKQNGINNSQPDQRLRDSHNIPPHLMLQKLGWVRQWCGPLKQNAEFYQRLASSVGRAPDCSAGSQGFEPQTGSTLRVLK